MYSKETIQRVKAAANDGYSERTIASIMKIPKSSVHYIIHNDYDKKKKKTGTPKKLKKRDVLSIKREVNKLSKKGSKVSSNKIKKNLDLQVSTRTIQKTMNEIGFRFGTVNNKLPLSQQHKEKRMVFAKSWLSNNHSWEITIFSDEKRFSLDGPDNFTSWQQDGMVSNRVKRQCGGGSIMVWGMVLPNGIIHLEMVEERMNSEAYINILQDRAIPIIEEYFDGQQYYFQQDNAACHVSKMAMQFFNGHKINLIEWPALSPDLNITENIWSMISRRVYDGPQFSSKTELWTAVQESSFAIQNEQNDVIINMFTNYRRRLVEVIEKDGDTIQY